jgi:hypothetical protein
MHQSSQGPPFSSKSFVTFILCFFTFLKSQNGFKESILSLSSTGQSTFWLEPQLGHFSNKKMIEQLYHDQNQPVLPTSTAHSSKNPGPGVHRVFFFSVLKRKTSSYFEEAVYYVTLILICRQKDNLSKKLSNQVIPVTL